MTAHILNCGPRTRRSLRHRFHPRTGSDKSQYYISEACVLPTMTLARPNSDRAMRELISLRGMYDTNVHSSRDPDSRCRMVPHWAAPVRTCMGVRRSRNDWCKNER
ncbi:hypothetical protein M408DRAFT_104412 [Serendipita vermifera MAFF 305830]|uniref:Uncharacterized protein n=1 Tax=Serendipita vermifera MAFF 305830 TaxID=933852 RepID=A0A0C2WVH2_SERVB|nr:hypothetical protein M408DRAFT_104412 [Serendipita vermifera MAFF 305830]